MTAPTSQPDFPSESRSQPDRRRQNRRFKTPVADHSQWRNYLAKRHILESVIAAGIWVEWDKSLRRDVLVWREKRRDGSPGAARLRLLPSVSNNGKGPKVIWQSTDEKSDEPFYYTVTLDDLKRHIAEADGVLYIVEGEVDVWSLHALGIFNVIGTYSATSIPPDIASILDGLSVRKVIYLADNDKADDDGATKLATLLLQSRWKDETEFRKVKGTGIPEKGDANDLLCHHYPDLAAARAALEALPTFLPQIEHEPAPNISIPGGYNDPRWDPVKEAVRIALDIHDYRHKGFSKKKFRCLDPQHDDPEASANWHRDGFCHCFGCGKDFNTKQMAEWLGIPWCALLGRERQFLPATDINLNAAPPEFKTASPPQFYAEPPDSLIRLLNKCYTTMHSSLYYVISRLRSAGHLPEAFSVQELIDVAPTVGCELKERAIYDNFEEARHGDDHPFIAKFDPSEGVQARNCKFRLRSTDDICDQLRRSNRFRVYEQEFQRDRDTILGFEIFAAALLESEFAIALEKAQKQRYERLVRKCEEIIACEEAALANQQATPLPPNWKIRKKSDLPAGKARAVSFNATAAALVAVSSLSFLGLGVQDTQFDWGRLITEGVLRLYQVPLLALAPATAIGITGLTLGYLGEALARGLNPVLWTQTASAQSRTWLQRYFSSEYMLLSGSTFLLIAFYFLPWFSPDALDPNRTLLTGAAILAGGNNLTAIDSGSQVAMLVLRASAWVALLLGIFSFFASRYRRFCAYLGLLCGLGAGSYFLSFLLTVSVNLGTALASAQMGFYLGLFATILLILQVISDKSTETRSNLDAVHPPSQSGAVEATASLPQPLLQVRGLTVRFVLESGIIMPVNDINVDLEEGEIVGIVGESGSGKSLTALAIAQLVPHPGVLTAQHVRLRGEDITTMPAGQLRYFLGSEMAMIFQDPMSSLNPALKIGTQLTEATRVHRGVRGKDLHKLALERMADVHISAAETRLRQYPHEFSGGMRQRAMIAMGLMTSPSLIIADEPTTALDVTIQAQIIDVLREINQEQGTTIMLISHDIGVIIEICSRVLVMYAGRIVEDVQITELMTTDNHPYTEALIAAVPAFDSNRDQPLASIPGRPPDLDNLPAGCAFAPRCKYVFDRCHQEAPPLLHVDETHRIACFLRTDPPEEVTRE